ncbi:hydrolase, partial [Paracoccus thiocyanatus]
MARGLIFDCDGVLVDSEPLAAAEIKAMLDRLGLSISHARIYEEFLGRSFSTVVAAARGQGLDLGPALPGYAEALALRFRRDLRAVPGMAEVLAQL